MQMYMYIYSGEDHVLAFFRCMPPVVDYCFRSSPKLVLLVTLVHSNIH